MTQGTEEVQKQVTKILDFLTSPARTRTLPFRLPDNIELKGVLDEVPQTTPTEGREFITDKRPEPSPWNATAADVAWERDAKRAPDAWRRGGGDIDEKFMIVVGTPNEDEVGVEDEPDQPNMGHGTRQWLTSSDFEKLVSKKEIEKLLSASD